MSEFATRIAEIAALEYEEYGRYSQTDRQMIQRIRHYYDVLSLSFSSVETGWSAVFVGYVVRSAGASEEEFRATMAHSEYVYSSISNARRNEGAFRGYSAFSVTPTVGDILQQNRESGNYDFEYASGHRRYFSYASIVVSVLHGEAGNGLCSVGGHDPDRLSRRTFRLDENVRLAWDEGAPFRPITIVRSSK